MLETENNRDKTANCYRWRLGPKNKKKNLCLMDEPTQISSLVKQSQITKHSDTFQEILVQLCPSQKHLTALV